jgi:hypothetical protein
LASFRVLLRTSAFERHKIQYNRTMSHSPSTRKRKAYSTESNSNSNSNSNNNHGQEDDHNWEHHDKVPVIMNGGSTTAPSTNNSDHPFITTAQDCTTLNYLLSVPLEIVFCQIPNDKNTNTSNTHTNINSKEQQQQGKPLLTRAEARCLLRITSLSQEWDLLMNTQTDSLQRSIWSKFFQHKIVTGTPPSRGMFPPPPPPAPCPGRNNNSHPYLRPLLPLLQVQGGPLVTRQTLHLLDAEMQYVIEQLLQCQQSLRQFAEHNWTLSESLWDAIGHDKDNDTRDLSQQQQQQQQQQQGGADLIIPNKGALLAREKRRLSDMEQELCERIDALMVTINDATTKPTSGKDDDDGDDENDNSQGKQNEDDASEKQKEQHDDNDNDDDKRKSQRGIESYDTSMATVCAQLWKLPMDWVKAGTSTGNGRGQEEQQQQQEQQVHVQQPGLFSYPEPIIYNNNQGQGYSAPLTMPAIDDPSVQTKPQDGLHNSSADMSDDDEETVMDQQPMMTEEDAQPANGNGQQVPHSEESNSHSQQSHHSIVSNLTDQEDNNDQQQAQQQQQQQQQQQELPKNIHTPTYAEVLGASEALVMFACQH